MSEKKKYRLPQIHGEMFRPCFMTEEEFEEGYKGSLFYTDKNFMEEYRKHMVGMSHVAECAKIYILKNWEKVTDWSGLDVIVVHGPTGKETEYFNYVPRKKYKENKSGEASGFSRFFDKIDEEDKAKHNPIREFNEVILDPTDGDFSITVNGNEEHWWIQDEAIIVIANYIEEKLKNEKNEEAEPSK